MVPFRLTHNMVGAMGCTGVNGAFRRSCEVALRIVRKNTDAFMSVLRPFVHDPLVEWSKPKKTTPTLQETGEIFNEKVGII